MSISPPARSFTISNETIPLNPFKANSELQLRFLGIALDADANTRNAATLSSAHRQVVVAVEPTNEEWADKMEGIGLMPSSTGKPGGSRTGEKMADYAIEGGLFMQATDHCTPGTVSIMGS